MAYRRANHFVAGTVNGGILAVVLCIGTRIWTAGGIGVLLDEPWPIGNIIVFAAIGSVVGLAAGTVLAVVRARHGQRIFALCEQMNLQYQEKVGRGELSGHYGLRLFGSLLPQNRSRWFSSRAWSEARNMMGGTLNGIDVEVIDYALVDTGTSSQDGEFTSTYAFTQTVALFPQCAPDSPRFELIPRDFLMKLFSPSSGMDGITFDPDAQMTVQDRDGVEQFQAAYFLSPRLDVVELNLQNSDGTWSDVVEGAEASADHPQAIRQLFNLDLLRFFAARPGWSVESDGHNIAIWRHNKVITASRRRDFLEEASDVCKALLEANAADNARVVAGEFNLDPRPAERAIWTIMFSAFGGCLIGGVAGFGISVAILDDLPFEVGTGIFFGLPLVGLVIGALLGRRLGKRRSNTIDIR